MGDGDFGNGCRRSESDEVVASGVMDVVKADGVGSRGMFTSVPAMTEVARRLQECHRGI